MDGITLRMKRLFRNGTLLLAALDHGQFVGVPDGLTDLGGFVRAIGSGPFDGYIMNAGAVGALDVLDPGKSLVLRITHAGTQLSGTGTLNRYFLRPEDALRLGADAVISMVVLGHDDDVAALHELAAAVCDYHRFGIPVIAEMLPADPKHSSSSKVIGDISRIGAEIGADVIKTCLTEDFAGVVASCPSPIIIAGGGREKDFTAIVRRAIESGAKGVAMGRNLYQHDEPLRLLRDVAVVMGRTST